MTEQPYHFPESIRDLLLTVQGVDSPTLTLYNTKAIVSGKKVEVTRTNRTHSKRWIRQSKPRTKSVTQAPDKKPERRKDNVWRAHQHVNRIAYANHTPNTRFFTLTCEDNITDRDEILRYFNDTISRMRSKGLCTDNIHVIEEQKERGDGTLHLHGLFFNIPFFLNEHFAELFWKKGFVRLKKIEDPNACANYVAKYFMKDGTEIMYIRLYSVSHGLKQPKEYYDKTIVSDIIFTALTKGYSLKVSKPYTSPYTGAISVYYTLYPPPN